jgi:hypothetical protein
VLLDGDFAAVVRRVVVERLRVEVERLGVEVLVVSAMWISLPCGAV